MDARINILEEKFNLSPAAAISILECIDAGTKYEKLPQVSRDNLQIICDLFNVGLTFIATKRFLILNGIFTPQKILSLTPKSGDIKLPKNFKRCTIIPGSNNFLTYY